MAVQGIQQFDTTAEIPEFVGAAGIGLVGGSMWAKTPDGGLINLGPVNVGTVYFVDVNTGDDDNNGLSYDAPFLTMAYAMTVIVSGDTIRFRGKLREQVTTPVQVFDVTVYGDGTRPRHADSTPDGGQDATNTWTTPASPTALTPLVKVLQQGWRFFNILFAGPTDAASILLFRDGGAGDAERDASHAEIAGCRFASGQDGIEQSGGCYNVSIHDNDFDDLTGYCIKHTTGAGIGVTYRWKILRNRFSKCANWIGVWGGNSNEINDNFISQITTALIDLSSGTGFNQILRNSFNIAAADFDPAGGVTGKAGDVWSNYLTDTIETGLPAN
jgi:hypothetical protein